MLDPVVLPNRSQNSPRRSCGCFGNAWRAVADLREWQVAFGWSKECRHQQLSWSVRAQLPMLLDPCFVNEMLSPAMCWMYIFLLSLFLCNVILSYIPLCACMSYSTSPLNHFTSITNTSLKLTNRTWKMMVGVRLEDDFPFRILGEHFSRCKLLVSGRVYRTQKIRVTKQWRVKGLRGNPWLSN